jgi:hypothetical protein
VYKRQGRHKAVSLKLHDLPIKFPVFLYRPLW